MVVAEEAVVAVAEAEAPPVPAVVELSEVVPATASEAVEQVWAEVAASAPALSTVLDRSHCLQCERSFCMLN